MAVPVPTDAAEARLHERAGSRCATRSHALRSAGTCRPHRRAARAAGELEAPDRGTSRPSEVAADGSAALGIYSFFVWLIFIKLKWLPWNTVSQVTVVIIPIVGLTALILLLNVCAPSSSDVRVIKYVVQVVPQVRGRVIEVPVEPNSPVKKGDVLFSIDPTPFELQVRTLEAQLATTEGSVKQLDEELTRPLSATTTAVRTKLELARTRVQQNRELVDDRRRRPLHAGTGRGRTCKQLEARARPRNVAAEAQVRARLGATVGDDQAEVAQIKAQLAQRALGALADGVLRARRRHGDQSAVAAGPDGDGARRAAR